MITNININLTKRSDFYNIYAKDKLCSALNDYIYNECLGEKVTNKIVINIYTKLKIDKNEKNDMIDIIRRNYGLQVQDKLYYYEIAKTKKKFMLVLGLILIIVYYSSFVSILREIILILGWLAIWESVYGLLFESPKEYGELTRLRNLAKARIYFKEGE